MGLCGVESGNSILSTELASQNNAGTGHDFLSAFINAIVLWLTYSGRSLVIFGSALDLQICRSVSPRRNGKAFLMSSALYHSDLRFTSLQHLCLDHSAASESNKNFPRMAQGFTILHSSHLFLDSLFLHESWWKKSPGYSCSKSISIPSWLLNSWSSSGYFAGEVH